MYTVVVADDEEELRNMLLRRVNWDEIGFEVVGEASNGIEALEMVERFSPDLLLTDIHMPFISGIELARQVREVRPTVQIAFLSGFDDFIYAQQAIQYNIISYMLKPISSAELTKELCKIKGIIDEKFKEFASRTQVEYKLEKAEVLLPLILSETHLDMDDIESDNEMIKCAVSCNLIQENNAKSMRYVVVVCRVYNEKRKNITTRKSIKAFDMILDKYIRHASFYVDGQVVSVLAATEKGFDKYLHILSEEFVQSTRRILDLDCQVGISRIVQSLRNCHECYMDAVNAISYTEKKEHVHYISDKERLEEFNHENVEKNIKEIESLIRGGSEEDLELFLKDFFGEIEKSNDVMETINYLTVQMISSVFRVVYSVAGNEAVKELKQYSPFQRISMFDNKEDAYDKYSTICMSAKKIVKDNLKKSSDIVCQQALNIIENEYSNPGLSLVSVSSEIAVSPNYLSSLLKRTTGRTFVEHLSNKRIEEAKNMLLYTPMKIREIADRCGYSDQHYFSYCFKKATGESPNNCRRSNE